MSANTKAMFSVALGRILFIVATATLIGAWITQVTGNSILGMSQQHLFNDTFALALLGIGSFLDSLYHLRKEQV